MDDKFTRDNIKMVGRVMVLLLVFALLTTLCFLLSIRSMEGRNSLPLYGALIYMRNPVLPAHLPGATQVDDGANHVYLPLHLHDAQPATWPFVTYAEPPNAEIPPAPPACSPAPYCWGHP